MNAYLDAKVLLCILEPSGHTGVYPDDQNLGAYLSLQRDPVWQSQVLRQGEGQDPAKED